LIIQGEEAIRKTFLVGQTLSKHVRLDDNGFFVHWNVLPDDGFEDAFASLTSQILTAKESILCEIQENFVQEMEENDQLTLSEMIPCISPLLGPFNPSVAYSGIRTMRRKDALSISLIIFIALTIAIYVSWNPFWRIRKFKVCSTSFLLGLFNRMTLNNSHHRFKVNPKIPVLPSAFNYCHCMLAQLTAWWQISFRLT
jgi:hypothetical protein